MELELNNGEKMPVLGLGTWRADKGVVAEAVKTALLNGYRHIDGAALYQNEAEVGDGMRSAFEEEAKRGVKLGREDIFLTSKLWNHCHAPELVEKACRESLARFGFEYLDLYLMHWPIAFKYKDDNYFPKKEDGSFDIVDIPIEDTWRAMESLVDKGLVKSIGVSNFSEEEIERVLKVARIKPVTNQVEAHPYLPQRALRDYCKSQGIVITAYCPLGNVRPDLPSCLNDATVKEIAEKLKKTPAQVLLRFGVQSGFSVIPKSVRAERLVENASIFDFVISEEDMERLVKSRPTPFRMVNPAFMPWPKL